MDVHEIGLRPGTYVLAVSGGVDSMTLLDMLHDQPGVQLIVAHFDHGIRSDSHKDHELVGQIAKQYGLSYIYESGNLGADASEGEAREARYAFLYRTRVETGARAIITAHHQDDMLETAIINMLRGTGSRGLSSLRSQGVLLRPLLGVTKQQIRDYAVKHNVAWREDSTNQDKTYLRNHVRHTIMPKLDNAARVHLLGRILRAAKLNQEIAALTAEYLGVGSRVDRRAFTQLPHSVSCEIMAAWLRQAGAQNLNKRLVERLVRDAKVLAPGKVADIDKERILRITKDNLEIRLRTLSQNARTSV
jgi:tRNA(Ile)-lysidine synthase